VVTHQVCPGTRDERGQLLDELRRLEQEVGRAIREGAAQLVAHLAIALHLKAVMRKRWAQHVATDALALVGVVWGYIEIGVQTEALGSSAARSRTLDPRYRPQRPQPLYAAARPLPQRDATLDRGGIARRQRGLFQLKWVGIEIYTWRGSCPITHLITWVFGG
jgi:hypothetical protein